jgi:hypothetical protein
MDESWGCLFSASNYEKCDHSRAHALGSARRERWALCKVTLFKVTLFKVTL